jgi:hypothetical protein
MLGRLLSSEDRSVDELVAGGLLALLVYCGCAAYDLVALGHGFGAMGFAGGVSTILAALAGALGWRSRLEAPAGRSDEGSR